MKKRVFSSIVLVVLFGLVGYFSVRPVSLAQNPLQTALAEYDQAYKDYLDAHKEYEIARSKYRTYQNLTSRTEAISKTADMLVTRDRVMIAFLQLIQTKITQEALLTYGRFEVINFDLNEEINWYNIHRLKPSSAATIEDLLLISKEAESRYNVSTQISYRALNENYLYKEEAIISMIVDELAQTDQLINLIRENDDKDSSVIERWLIDAQNRYALGKGKFEEARSLDLANVKVKEVLGKYNNNTLLLEQANQYFKEVNLGLIEIINEIKRAD